MIIVKEMQIVLLMMMIDDEVSLVSSTNLPFFVCHFIDVKDSYNTVVITRTEWELDFLRMALPDSMRGINNRS
jgi:hypothetical protein